MSSPSNNPPSNLSNNPPSLSPQDIQQRKLDILDKYGNDERYICIEEEDDVVVTKKWEQEDWDKMENMIDTHPLFAKEIDDIENNELLQALQQIKYDESAEVILEKLYKDGNETMKNKLLGQKKKEKFFLKKAMETYSDALAQEASCVEIRAKILSNRALLHMWARNYGKAIEDCMEAIKLNYKFIKPYVRASECLLNLGMYEKCLKLADKGLSIEFAKELKGIRDDASRLLSAQSSKEEAKKAKLEETDKNLIEACASNGIVLGKPSDYPLPQVYNRKPILQDGILIFPIVFLYPEFGQFDYLEQTLPEASFFEAFEQIFQSGLPWDSNGFYKNHNDIAFALKVCKLNLTLVKCKQAS